MYGGGKIPPLYYNISKFVAGEKIAGGIVFRSPLWYTYLCSPCLGKKTLVFWEKPPGQVHNFISGCCAVGSAPALGAGGPGFESPHSDQILQKNRLNRRFFCILSLIFVVLEIAVLRRFQWWNSGRGMSERSRRNRQIPNPSLTGKLPHFLRFYRCRCRPLLIVCLRCVGREAGFLLL